MELGLGEDADPETGTGGRPNGGGEAPDPAAEDEEVELVLGQTASNSTYRRETGTRAGSIGRLAVSTCTTVGVKSASSADS